MSFHNTWEQPSQNHLTPPQEKHEERSRYGLRPEEHPLYDQYRPEFLGKGGEHLVYTLPGHDRIVFKVHHEYISALLEEALSRNTANAEFIERRLRGLAHMVQRRQNELSNFFGKEHLVRQRATPMKLPFSRGVLEDLLKEKMPPMEESLIELPVVARIQEKVDFSDPAIEQVLDVTSSYAEKSVGEDPDSLRNYAQGSEQWVLDHSSGSPFDPRLFSECQHSTALDALLKEMEQDSDLKEVVKDFVTKAVTYSEDSLEILDLAGKDNVVFLKTKEGWKYLLIDAVYPGVDTGILLNGQRALYKYAVDKQELDGAEAHDLYNVLNYTRTINGLAHAVGVEERIHLFNEADFEGKTIDWDEVRRYLLRRLQELRS